MELKTKSLDEKIEAIKNYLADENNEDLKLSLNLYNLIKYDNDWDESFFKHPDIIFNSILEFIQIKTALKNELSIFCEKLINIYYNCIYHCSDIMVTEEAKSIPVLYRNILLQCDFIFLSKLLNEYKITSFNEVYYADAFSILVPMANKLSILHNFIAYNTDILEASTKDN